MLTRIALPVGIVAVVAGGTLWLQTRERIEPWQQHYIDVSAEELLPFAKYDGPDRASEHYEEAFIRDFFQDRRGGCSSTSVPTTTARCRTPGISSHSSGGRDWLLSRRSTSRPTTPPTIFVPMFATDRPGGRATLYVPQNNRLIASSSQQFTTDHGETGKPQDVPAATITAIDFLSMDIELHEPQTLKGFDIAKYRPALVCIEAHADVRQPILDYFQQHQYVVVGKYLRVDVSNLYFQPAR